MRRLLCKRLLAGFGSEIFSRIGARGREPEVASPVGYTEIRQTEDGAIFLPQ